MRPATLNMARSLAGFILTVVVCAWAAPALVAAKQWPVGPVAVTAMLVFVAYTLFYLTVGLAYIIRKRGYDRHIFPEGLKVEGPMAVKLGLKYLILSSIAAFGATLLYAVILRGMRYSHLMN